MQKVRNHLINFRVTEEEFEQLRMACDRQGARCLSHFVRNVMLKSAEPEADSVVTRVLTLDRRVTALETRLQSSSLQEAPQCV